LTERRRPWFKFHTQDWRADPALRMCSPAARGLWADMLSLMHEADPYGHLLVGGIAPSDAQLARLLSIDETLIGSLIGDLSANCVFSRTDAGVIFSRRMVRDAEESNKGRDHISKRWGNSTKSRGVTSSPIRGANRGPIGKNDAEPITKSQSQSQSNTASLRSAAAHRKTRIEKDAPFSERAREIAASKNFVNGSAEGVWEAFRDYHVANGSLFADWDAAWRTWLRNQDRFAPRGSMRASRPDTSAIIARVAAEVLPK